MKSRGRKKTKPARPSNKKASSKKQNPLKKSPAPGAAPAENDGGPDAADMQSILTEVRGVGAKKRIEHSEQLDCPYCGETFEFHIDSAEDGLTVYEDCHVCCKPISLHIQVEEEDVLISIARA